MQVTRHGKCAMKEIFIPHVNLSVRPILSALFSYIYSDLYSDLGDFQCFVYVVYVHKVANNVKPQISKNIKVSIKNISF